MNIDSKKIFMYSRLLSTDNKGFTLIELLVVVVIVGVLAAIALPNLIGQIGKARETEGKTTLGSLARSQQAYHFEANTFYNGNNLAAVGISTSGEYYNFTVDNAADGDKALHTAYATNPSNFGARDLAVGVYSDPPQYSQTLCIAEGVDIDGTTSSVTARADGTCNGGNQIQ